MALLGKALNGNVNLHLLNLENCEITEKSEETFLELFSTMALKELNISRNPIKNKGALAISKTLLENQTCIL